MRRIFTDGACSGNPGPGGWAFIVLDIDDVIIKSGGSKVTTNNRMELKALVESLKYALESEHTFFRILSDSAYVVNSINNNWVSKWKLNGWKTSEKTEVKNKDLWAQYLTLMRYMQEANKKVEIGKVKGHDGNTFNEMADKYARKEVTKIQRGEA